MGGGFESFEVITVINQKDISLSFNTGHMKSCFASTVIHLGLFFSFELLYGFFVFCASLARIYSLISEIYVSVYPNYQTAKLVNFLGLARISQA